MFPEGAPQRHINWKKEDYELFVGHGHGAVSYTHLTLPTICSV